MRGLSFFLMLAILVPGLRAETITGTIQIRKVLTKRSIGNPVSIYERGQSVGPNEKPQDADPLDFERSRVVIWLEGPGPAIPVQAVMQQIGRRFVPDLLVIPAGSTVAFPNLDPIFHNVFSLSKPRLFDLGNYVKGDSRSVTFPKPGIVYVNCHLHPNMAAAIVVTPNRWYAKAEGNGQFALHDVPPGEYTAVAWHKAAGFFRKTILVTPHQSAVLDFFIPLGESETLKPPGPKSRPELN
jgi:plastocyanin